MEGLVRRMFWRGRKVFITGHTGFKGGWLSLWLNLLGADVAGYALAPLATPNFFDAGRVGELIKSTIADICDYDCVIAALRQQRPEVVFHLAAQPLVRTSYVTPLETYRTNVLGTCTILEAVRECDSVRAVVVITTDKCYENREWVWAYRENDALGGYDPYSNSKACAELVVSSWRQSFFLPADYAKHGVALATARAGNVIGGGDWSADRLIPDIVRAFLIGECLTVRNPNAIRPWQHVLEPLRGYLMLARRLLQDGPAYGQAWNFGPRYEDARPVDWLVSGFASQWGRDTNWKVDSSERPHEAQTLKLDWTKAMHELGWTPVIPLEEALRLTADWYRAWNEGADMREYSERQIKQYIELSEHETNRVGL